MKRSQAFFWAVVLVVLLGGCRTEKRPRHLILISVDTLRADALGFMGHSEARTPVIDRLASEGTAFTNAVTTMPRTTPGLASLMTGRWPSGHLSREVGDPIAENVTTLAEVLKAQGFRTLAVSANSTAGPNEGLARGFDDFVTYEDLVERYGERLYRDLSDVAPDQPGWATAVTDEGLRLLEEAEEPLFLWLFYFDPHLMYRPPSPWQDGVSAEKCWELYDHYDEYRDVAGQVFADVGGIASRAVEDCRRLYDAEIAYTDAEIGRLLQGLEGLLDDSLVVFTADHGENFGEGGLFFEHGDNVHDAGLRVPLIFRGPGIAAGRRDDGVVSLVDVVPTVVGLLGLGDEAREADVQADGVDLGARLRFGESEPPPRSRVVFAESASSLWNEAVDQLVTGRQGWTPVCVHGERFTLCDDPKREPRWQLYDHVADPQLNQDVADQYPQEVEVLREAHERWPAESARQRTVRGDRFKLVQRPLLEGGWGASLYDLANDPAEENDVSGDHPVIYQGLLRQLEGWVAQAPTGTDERPMDPELAKRLRDLGYLSVGEKVEEK